MVGRVHHNTLGVTGFASATHVAEHEHWVDIAFSTIVVFFEDLGDTAVSPINNTVELGVRVAKRRLVVVIVKELNIVGCVVTTFKPVIRCRTPP